MTVLQSYSGFVIFKVRCIFEINRPLVNLKTDIVFDEKFFETPFKKYVEMLLFGENKIKYKICKIIRCEKLKYVCGRIKKKLFTENEHVFVDFLEIYIGKIYKKLKSVRPAALSGRFPSFCVTERYPCVDMSSNIGIHISKTLTLLYQMRLYEAFLVKFFRSLYFKF